MWTNRETYLKYHRDRMNAVYRRWRAAGLCGACGSPDNGKYALCFRHRLMRAESNIRSVRKCMMMRTFVWNDNRLTNPFTIAAAFRARERRRETQPLKIDNSRLYAGSPMYFYCASCGHESDVLPENYLKFPRRFCDPCGELVTFGWIK